MVNIIDITNLSNLPKETLAIIKDTNDNICLGIKSNSIDTSSIEFKGKNIFIDNSSIYALMIKNNNSTIYKCLVPLNSISNKSILHKLINQDRFNLIIFKDGNEQDIFRIENTNKKELNDNFLKALIDFDSTLELSNKKINEYLSNQELWNE